MKADLYSLTPAMMKIADNPTDPWLDEYLKAEGLVPYKFGVFRGKAVRKQEPVLVSESTPVSRPAVTETGHSQELLNYLADKVKE